MVLKWSYKQILYSYPSPKIEEKYDKYDIKGEAFA